MTRHLLWNAFGVVLLTTLAGCAQESTPFGEVEGRVTLGDKPLANVLVQFVPDAAQGTKGTHSTAMTDDQGHYVLNCADGRPGAVVGRHIVTIIFKESWQNRTEDPRDPNAKPRPATPNLVPPRYQSSSTTPERHEVREGKQVIDLKLTP